MTIAAFVLGFFAGVVLAGILFSAFTLGGRMDREWEAFRRGYDTGLYEGEHRK